VTAATVLRATHKTKFDNRKKIDFFKTKIDFWKKTKLTSLVDYTGTS